MKIANITLHAIVNYGSALQALATERIFQSLGYEVETIDYIPETSQLNSVRKILKYGGPDFKLKLKQLILYFLPARHHRNEVLDVFRRKYLHLSAVKYLSDKELEDNPPVADVYCTGSDQTWNTVCQRGVPKPFFLHFVPEGKKRIAFSASFGIESLPKRDVAEVKELLSKYDSISVRENSGLEILNELGITSASQVLDPTLTVNPTLWDELASPKQFEEDYILAYQLNQSSSFENYVKGFAEYKDIKVVYIRSSKVDIRNCTLMPDVKPEDWLSLFKYAKYIITDSFHATVFSVLFHRNFVNIYPPRYSTRLESFLELLNLKERKLVDYADYIIADKTIDYVKVDKVLQDERCKSMLYLKNIL